MTLRFASGPFLSTPIDCRGCERGKVEGSADNPYCDACQEEADANEARAIEGAESGAAGERW